MSATGATAAGMETAGTAAASAASASSSYVPGRPKRQSYRRANTDRISAAAAAAAANSYAPDPLYDSASSAKAAAGDDPYVSCFGGGGAGNYGAGYCVLEDHPFMTSAKISAFRTHPGHTPRNALRYL